MTIIHSNPGLLARRDHWCPWHDLDDSDEASSFSHGVLEPRLLSVKKTILHAPRHLLVIPDGHRRWAKQYNLSHEIAYKTASTIGTSFVNYFLRSESAHTLSLFLIAEHTLVRSVEELNPIFNALNEFLYDVSFMPSSLCSISVIGNLELLPKQTRELSIKINKRLTIDNKSHKRLNLLIGYSGTRNIRRFSEGYKMQSVAPIDIVYRMGGKYRLSDAPIMEAHNGFLLVLPTLFPDLDANLIETPFIIIDTQTFPGDVFKINATSMGEPQ